MSDIIRLLPDAVANQIAAGEVVQRPASVVKELVENAIDSGAGEIRVILKNVGKSVIQVIDNGKGMSPADARMAFERHATSKIADAGDLFNIRTLGFRGEALPSIASVAEVELKTRREEDELGSSLYISASEIKKQEPINCPKGSNFCVRNLFFNIPARRKFLKSDQTELRNAIAEFLRIALPHPECALRIENNENVLYDLPAGGLRQRIVNVFGKSIQSKLLSIDCKTSLVTIQGFVCSPAHARKTYGEQYFFVNNRFMKHTFFHKAVIEAYSGLIAPDALPSYFLYFTVDPALIDVNIHPTKTEIKFQHETDFFQILLSGIKEALGKFNITPPLDFDTEGDVTRNQGYLPPDSTYTPKVGLTPGYTPFNYKAGICAEESGFESGTGYGAAKRPEKAPANWETLFEGLKESEEPRQATLPGLAEAGPAVNARNSFLQMKGRYIVTPVHSGLMFIDQKKAHERILFELYLDTLSSQKISGQKSLFPETLELSADDFALIREIREDLEYAGFELKESEENSYVVYATPPDLSCAHAQEVLARLIEHYKNTEGDIREKMKERVALSLAKAAAIDYNTLLSSEEMGEMVDNLFACRYHNHTADGKTIIHILKSEEVHLWFR